MDLGKFRNLDVVKEKSLTEKCKIFFLGYQVTEEEKALHKVKYYTYYQPGGDNNYVPLKSTPNLFQRIVDYIINFFSDKVANYRENRIIASRRKYFMELDKKADIISEKYHPNFMKFKSKQERNNDDRDTKFFDQIVMNNKSTNKNTDSND